MKVDLVGQEVSPTFHSALSSFCLFLQAQPSSWEELTEIFLELLYSEEETWPLYRIP